MANKQFKYEISYHPPQEMDKTPAQRQRFYVEVPATSVPRALNKAYKEILDRHECTKGDLLVVEARVL